MQIKQRATKITRVWLHDGIHFAPELSVLKRKPHGTTKHLGDATMETLENIGLSERIVRFTAGLALVLGSLQFDVDPMWLVSAQLAAAYACISAMTGYDLVKGVVHNYRQSEKPSHRPYAPRMS